MSKFPSIFNEVVGPIMRGCSSSHVAAGLRIGLIAHDLLDGKPACSTVTFDSNEALSASYDGQGSAMGYSGGLLGFPPDSTKLDQARNIAIEQGVNISFVVDDVPTNHPNTYLIEAEDHNGRKISMEAVSLGGGAIEIWRLMDIKVCLAGDLYLTVFHNKEDAKLPHNRLEDIVSSDLANVIKLQHYPHSDNNSALIIVESREPLSEHTVAALTKAINPAFTALVRPVMPVLAGAGNTLPFTSVEEMLAYGKGKMNLADLAYCYEEARSGFDRKQLFDLMANIATVMRNSIDEGIKGTHYDDRILPAQAPLTAKLNNNPLIQSSMQRSIAYVTALMDMKSSMGLIVAAPTGGACGALGGAIWSAVDNLHLGTNEATDALMAAGIIGVFIAKDATFSGEEGGCQAECGSGSAMAAAALVHLMGGTAEEAVKAASLALQNTLGLVCDTVADRVEFPCLGRNIMSATNALSSAGMAIAGYSNIIPLDETILAMSDIASRMPIELRCTGKGGLAITKTGLSLHKRLLAGESIQILNIL